MRKPIVDALIDRLVAEAVALSRHRVGESGIPFAALVVDHRGELLGRGVNQVTEDHDPTAHAEVVAIREACRHRQSAQLNGSLLIASSEPCALCYMGDGGPVSLRALRLAVLRRPALHQQLPRLRRPGRRDHPLHLPAGARVVPDPAADARTDIAIVDWMADNVVQSGRILRGRIWPRIARSRSFQSLELAAEIGVVYLTRYRHKDKERPVFTGMLHAHDVVAFAFPVDSDGLDGKPGP